MSVKDTIATLEQKNKALCNQLDKVTADLFKMQDKAVELNNKLELRKHSEQLAGWAVDRAIEFARLAPEAGRPMTVAGLITMAKNICDGLQEITVEQPIPQPEKQAEETIQ